MPTNIGKAGEQAFAHKLRGSKYQVEDLTGNPAYFDKDIDFLVINPETGNRRAYEVKSDSRISQTGNLFIETWNRNSPKQNGWYKFCEADYIAYFDFQQKFFHCFSFADLRAVVDAKEWPRKTCGNDSLGYLVPLEEIKKQPSYMTM